MSRSFFCVIKLLMCRKSDGLPMLRFGEAPAERGIRRSCKSLCGRVLAVTGLPLQSLCYTWHNILDFLICGIMCGRNFECMNLL